ncbi:MAG: type II toxin-antitoxin system RelE/ParE family toxin [Pseudomonadales bacterium]|jgi:phage-related protein/DNA-binding Xre family transcriptional regulator
MEPLLSVVFFVTDTGKERVREFLRALAVGDRKAIGTDLKTVQFGWPMGMPLVRKLDRGLWEVRSDIANGIVRVLFTVSERQMVLLHAFVKKAQKTPVSELSVAKATAAKTSGGSMNKHIGGKLDDLLAEDGLQEEVTAAAINRVIAWQLTEAMNTKSVTRTEMAARMHTSRMVVNRLLDANDTSVTLATLSRASVALGIQLRLELGD